jgi:hypothetical protein
LESIQLLLQYLAGQFAHFKINGLRFSAVAMGSEGAWTQYEQIIFREKLSGTLLYESAISIVSLIDMFRVA